MEIVWFPSEEQRESTVEVIRSEGAEVKDRLGFEPLAAIGVIMAVGILVRSLTKLYRDVRFKGVLIDATKSPVEIREMPGWSRRQALLLTQEGAELLEIGDKESIEDQLGKIKSLLGEGT